MSSVRKLSRAVEAFRQIHKDILANEILSFLLVAETDGISQQDIKERLGLSQASTSRNINFLSQHGANLREGLRLVMTAENPANRRQKLVYLTPKGKSFKRQLEVLINGAA